MTDPYSDPSSAVGTQVAQRARACPSRPDCAATSPDQPLVPGPVLVAGGGDGSPRASPRGRRGCGVPTIDVSRGGAEGQRLGAVVLDLTEARGPDRSRRLPDVLGPRP